MDRKTITEEEAIKWDYRKHGPRPLTVSESKQWDRAQAEGDRVALLRLRRTLREARRVHTELSRRNT